MKTCAEITDPWLVVAGVCDCDKTAVPIMRTARCAPSAAVEAEHDGEVVLTGPEWSPLVERVATEMSARSRTTISACCTVVVASGDEEQRRIQDAAVCQLQALYDAAREGSSHDQA